MRVLPSATLASLNGDSMQHRFALSKIMIIWLKYLAIVRIFRKNAVGYSKKSISCGLYGLIF